MSEQPVTPALQRRLTGTLFISESLFSASVIASFTLMPIVAQELTGRDSLAGIPSTMMLIGQAAAAYPLGRLMDRFGRRTGLSIGYFIAAAGAVLATLAIGWGAFVGFIFGTFLYGVGRAGGLQARFAAAEITPRASAASKPMTTPSQHPPRSSASISPGSSGVPRHEVRFMQKDRRQPCTRTVVSGASPGSGFHSSEP